ncbi:acyl carrier protein [Ferruginibacter paludis]|uniref:acyl carrier protein n=1 Tax=Ferruginibacter paludis TaxID=1310417 RepID=UPI0025B2DE07|nr:acyl carrier protein [Ferruginibacter paludis]MDN3658905.1 acyl carrier protein [Ferruginibacter paludis]
MENKTLDGLTEIFRKVFAEPGLVLTERMSSRDVEKWDSLAHLIMIKEVETYFHISFKIRELASIQNVGDLICVVDSKLKDQSNNH